jgi:hypothetical protein
MQPCLNRADVTILIPDNDKRFTTSGECLDHGRKKFESLLPMLRGIKRYVCNLVKFNGKPSGSLEESSYLGNGEGGGEDESNPSLGAPGFCGPCWPRHGS